MKFGLAAIAAILVASPALSATADNPFASNRAVLDLRGLDLTSVEGQQRLAIRMDQAATTVCGEGLSRIHLALEKQTRACRAGVIADIRTRIATATAARQPAKAVQLALR